MELPTPAPLNSKQSALLRRYWHDGRQGLSSTGGTQALELAALGLIEQARYGGSGLIRCITQAGIVALQAQVKANRARCASHHDFGVRLNDFATTRDGLLQLPACLPAGLQCWPPSATRQSCKTCSTPRITKR
jgi:hypothetical protein